MANHALKLTSGEERGDISISFLPMKIELISKSEFYTALQGIFPYIQIMMFLLPIYMHILRLQEEKQIGIQQHLHVLGLSYAA